MSFEDRNSKWTGKEREFRQTQTKSSTPRVWRVWVQGDTITTVWGQLGGAMQTVSEKANAVNVGKKNEISPEDYALYLGREKCRKKHWEGYREIGPKGKPLDELTTEIDFDNPPLNLAFWKPDNSPGPGITKKAENAKVWYARKMNGVMFPSWKGKGKAFLTSRRMLRQNDNETDTPLIWGDRFPHLIDALEKVMPPNSAVLGELVAFDKENKDNLQQIGSYTKALTMEALKDQASRGWAFLYVWDVAFWDGVPLIKEAPIRQRYELIHENFKAAPFIPVQFLTPEAGKEWYGDIPFMRKLAIKLGWEGFVMVDPDGVFEDKAYNFKGKPDRPSKFAAKVKPEYEDDFIVYWNPKEGYGEFSTKGRYGESGVKSVCLYQLNSKGEPVYIANCASGLTEEMKSTIKPSKKPLGVWKIVYSDRRYISDGDDTNAIDFPRFESVRDDKAVEECINPRL